MSAISDETRTGGAWVCAALKTAGCDVIFSVSGNQILPIYDAAPDAGLRIVHMRHESAAAYAAAAYAEITGSIGVALTSAGPGFLAALQGIAAASTMELPLLFLSGDSSVSQRGKGAFQELNQSAIAQNICKSTLVLNEAGDIATMIARAAAITRGGVPGPVHMSLPGDVLADTAAATHVDNPPDPSALDEEQRQTLDSIARQLIEANRPLVLARPSAGRGTSGKLLRKLARSLGIEPIIIEAPRGLADLKYAGISASFPDSDCTLVLAPPDFAVGFLNAENVARDGTILLVSDSNDPSPDRTVDLHLQIDTLTVLKELNTRISAQPSVAPEWSELWPIQAPPGSEPPGIEGIHPLAVSEALRATINSEDIIILDGGEFCQWVRLGLRDVPNPIIWNGKIGAIGGSIPMGIGAAVALPQRRVISIMGDGAAGYHLSEFETMGRYSLPITVIIGNDARWAAEWHLQIARYGKGRTIETELTNARYDEAAASFAAVGERITDADDLNGALQEALGRQRATCINVSVAALPSPAAMT